MQVHVVGDDPVYEAVVAALGDVDVSVMDASPNDLADARFGVVADVAGSSTLNEQTRRPCPAERRGSPSRSVASAVIRSNR